MTTTPSWYLGDDVLDLDVGLVAGPPALAFRGYPIGHYILRSDQTDGAGDVLTGHMAVFNEPTLIDSKAEGRFVERIAPGAFAKTITQD